MPHAAFAGRWGPLAGVASAVIPAAVLVHLVAEGMSLGPAGLGLDFVLRHVYLAALVAASLVAFGRTVGIGKGRAEIRRRTALLRAGAGALRRPAGLAVLVGLYLAFFFLTQIDEGLPILSGALWLGLAAGTIGSIVAAVVVFAFGRAALAAAVAALDWPPRRPAAAPRRAALRIAPPRAAARAFTLFVPNRPPPHDPFTRIITQLEGIVSCSALSARRCGRRRSSLQLQPS